MAHLTELELLHIPRVILNMHPGEAKDASASLLLVEEDCKAQGTHSGTYVGKTSAPGAVAAWPVDQAICLLVQLGLLPLP
jgi:hypothetical protein